MRWFSKAKPNSGVDAVRQYSKVVYAEIDEAKKILVKATVFDPGNRKHLRLAQLILSISSNIPETRCADTRSLDWSESKYSPFKINSRRLDRVEWFSYGQRIAYRDQLVFEWENSSEAGEHFMTVRLGAWCNELFEIVRGIRQDIEEEVLNTDRDLAYRREEFEATRFQPLN